MSLDPNSVSEFKSKVDSIDLESVKFRLVRDENWTREQADSVEPLYKGYLLLIALQPNHSLIPNKLVDKMWHTHILDTQKYYADCENTFGFFVHHIPSRSEMTPEQEDSMKACFEATKRLFRDVVGFDFNRFGGENDAAICMDNCGSPDPEKEARNLGAICMKNCGSPDPKPKSQVKSSLPAMT